MFMCMYVCLRNEQDISNKFFLNKCKIKFINNVRLSGFRK